MAQDLSYFARGTKFDFLQNSFCNNTIYIKRVCKCMVDVRSASRGAWQDHAHFLENYNKKTDEYFSMILFTSSRLCCGTTFFCKFCRACRDTEMGVAGQHPFFIKKIITIKRMNIFHDSFCNE